MSLLHPAMLSGLGLALIPVVLHLLLRAKPKRLVFPALRLIQQNRRQNVRRLQLRHVWLLLLRILVIALIVIALSRPSLPAANYALAWYEWLMIIVVLGLGGGSYAGIVSWWRRRKWPRNQFLTRRSMLRGSIGAATACLLALGVGWPYARRVSAEIKSPAPRIAENIPVAAIFLFDVSPSMGYRHNNQTRLQSAQEIAREHLSRLPAGSKVAISSSHETTAPAFSLDLQAAKSRIDACDLKAVGRPLNECLRTSLLAQEDDRRRITTEQGGPEEKRQDRYLREIYLFTDLTRPAWRDETSTLLRDELKRLETVGVYLIDVGEMAPSNVGLTNVKLLRETIAAGGTLKLDAVLSCTGTVKPEQTVELLIGVPGGGLIKQGNQTVTVEPGTEKRLRFEVPNRVGRFQQGEVRLVGSDPLAADDVGYFTVQTLPPLRVLLVAESASIAKYWQLMLDYIALEKITDFKTEVILPQRLSSERLAASDVVCLINVSAPDDGAWVRLRNYVEAGGGLCVFLGAKSTATSQLSRPELINPLAYNSTNGQTLMPALLKASLQPATSQTMDLRNSQHPLLKRLDDLTALAELGATDVHQYWKVEPRDDAIVIAKYSGENAPPALIERRVGLGRVMLMTTSVDDPEWNDLVGNAWSFVFADQLMQYLSQQASSRYNFQVGQEVELPLDRDRKLKKVVVRMPDFKQRPQDLPLEAKSLTLRDLTVPGSYQVDSADGEVDYHMGFSLNLPPQESDLQRLTTLELDALLGEGRYSMNRDPGSLERNVLVGRLGQEVYGLIVTLLIAFFALEQFTATWFYRTDEA